MELVIHHPASPYVRKVLLLVEELGESVRERIVDVASQSAMDDYRSMNPTGKFPTLCDGDLVLRESNAIMIYLADRHPEQGLYGASARTTAAINQWLFWELAHFAAIANPYAGLCMGYPVRTGFTIDELAADFRTRCSLLDSQLEKTRFVAGDALSIADLAIAADLSFADEAALPLGDYGNLDRWFATIRERPSWQVTEERKRQALANG